MMETMLSGWLVGQHYVVALPRTGLFLSAKVFMVLVLLSLVASLLMVLRKQQTLW